MNKFLKFFVLTGSCLASFSVMAATETCQATPDCVSIGFIYTASECSGLEKIKCPFDDYYFCSKTPDVECNTSAGLYSSCPKGAFCPDGLKVDGCYTAEECNVGMGYTPEKTGTNATCNEDTFKNYQGNTVTCYSSCGCNTANGMFGTLALCQQEENAGKHRYCYKGAEESCFHAQSGVCASNSCKFTSSTTASVSCYVAGTCSGYKYYAGPGSQYTLGRIYSGQGCAYQKRKGSNYTSDDSRCIDKNGSYLTDAGLDYYQNCECDTANGYQLLRLSNYDQNSCRCVLMGSYEVNLSTTTSYNGIWKMTIEGSQALSYTATIYWDKVTYNSQYKVWQSNGTEARTYSGTMGDGTPVNILRQSASGTGSNDGVPIRWGIGEGSYISYTNTGNAGGTYKLNLPTVSADTTTAGTGHNSYSWSGSKNIRIGNQTNLDMDL